jgi:acyl-CoA thioester hydrolase
VFEYPLTPRYLEVDQLGVVFNMWYLGYFDEAMTGFLASLGLPYPELVAAGHDIMLVRTELDWAAPLRYGQSVRVAVRVESVGRTSFVLRFDVAHDGRATCRGRTVYVFVARDGSGKRDLPPTLRAGLERHLEPATSS